MSDMEKSFFDPIKIPPLPTVLSVFAKLIFHFLGHVFWFSGILMLAIMGYHGGYPVIESVFDGVISFRAILPPALPIEVPAMVQEVATGLIRLMVVAFGLAMAALFAGGILVLALSIAGAVLSLPIHLARWLRAIFAEPVRPLPRPQEQPEGLDCSVATQRANAAEGDEPSLDWVRDAGAWTMRTLKQAHLFGKEAMARAKDLLNQPPTAPRF